MFYRLGLKIVTRARLVLAASSRCARALGRSRGRRVRPAAQRWVRRSGVGLESGEGPAGPEVRRRAGPDLPGPRAGRDGRWQRRDRNGPGTRAPAERRRQIAWCHVVLDDACGRTAVARWHRRADPRPRWSATSRPRTTNAKALLADYAHLDGSTRQFASAAPRARTSAPRSPRILRWPSRSPSRSP